MAETWKSRTPSNRSIPLLPEQRRALAINLRNDYIGTTELLLPLNKHRHVCQAMRTIGLFHLALVSDTVIPVLGCLISCTYEWPSGKEAVSIVPG